MKNGLLLAIAICSLNIYAQDECIFSKYDSLALNTTFSSIIAEPLVYYISADTLSKISPISFSSIKTSGFIGYKSQLVFTGSSSKNKTNQKILYIYMSDVINSIYSIENFRIVKLDEGRSERLMTASVAAPFYARVGANSDATTSTEIGKGWYRVMLPSQIVIGEYGVFCNLAGGVPVKIYDFTIQ